MDACTAIHYNIYNEAYVNKRLKKDGIIRRYILINYIKKKKKEIISNVNLI